MHLSSAKIGKLIGPENPHWLGGKTRLAASIRNSEKYLIWRSAVFVRDNWTCQGCGHQSEGDIEAHHIKPIAVLLKEYGITEMEQAYACEQLWDVANGTTYCTPCHETLKRGGGLVS